MQMTVASELLKENFRRMFSDAPNVEITFLNLIVLLA